MGLASTGGIKPGEGMALANEEVTILRLNVSIIVAQNLFPFD
jgi:hypothetical protein